MIEAITPPQPMQMVEDVESDGQMIADPTEGQPIADNNTDDVDSRRSVDSISGTTSLALKGVESESSTDSEPLIVRSVDDTLRRTSSASSISSLVLNKDEDEESDDKQ